MATMDNGYMLRLPVPQPSVLGLSVLSWLQPAFLNMCDLACHLKRKRFHCIVKDLIVHKIAGLVSEDSTALTGYIKNHVAFKFFVFHKHHPPLKKYLSDEAEQAYGLAYVKDQVVNKFYKSG